MVSIASTLFVTPCPFWQCYHCGLYRQKIRPGGASFGIIDLFTAMPGNTASQYNPNLIQDITRYFPKSNADPASPSWSVDRRLNIRLFKLFGPHRNITANPSWEYHARSLPTHDQLMDIENRENHVNVLSPHIVRNRGAQQPQVELS